MSKILIQAIDGQETERRPLWVMRQAGRYLPEYRELRKSYTFEQLSGSPELATEVTLMPFERFAFDGAILFADLMSPIPALGIPVRFDPGPVIDNPIRSRADIDALPELDPEEIAPSVMETLRQVKPKLAPHVTLLGFAGAPLSLAAYLVQGRGVRGFPLLRVLAAEDPATFEALMAKLSRLSARYLIEQSKAGAEAVQIFDSWGGLLSRADWRRLVRPHLKELLEEVGRAGVRRILFAQDAAHLVDDLLELPSEAISLDWRVDLAEIRQRVPDKTLQGNLDPAVLLAGPETTRAAAKRLLEHVPKHRHIFNLGHGILPQTSLESMEALIEVVHGEE